MNDIFKVKIGDFEGPLDLLLTLIEKRKLHISDISLTQVTEDYIAFLENPESSSMTNLANFITVASTLMLIKSSALLPGLALTEEEKESIEDLENRLKHYQKIKGLSLHLKERFNQQNIYNREPNKETIIVFSPTSEVTKDNLWQTIKNVLLALPKKEILPKMMVRKIISLEEVIDNLTHRMQDSIKMRFGDFIQDKKEKINIIIHFLGMLELVKRGIVEIEQKGAFADIDMESKSIGVPRY
ncbi:MAG: ScpA family protein [Candidatus Vogelbacteria bacterium]|nr:ScpA family protein [Candidatus Vogelbacteria bacterium]